MSTEDPEPTELVCVAPNGDLEIWVARSFWAQERLTQGDEPGRYHVQPYRTGPEENGRQVLGEL